MAKKNPLEGEFFDEELQGRLFDIGFFLFAYSAQTVFSAIKTISKIK